MGIDNKKLLEGTFVSYLGKAYDDIKYIMNHKEEFDIEIKNEQKLLELVFMTAYLYSKNKDIKLTRLHQFIVISSYHIRDEDDKCEFLNLYYYQLYIITKCLFNVINENKIYELIDEYKKANEGTIYI